MTEKKKNNLIACDPPIVQKWTIADWLLDVDLIQIKDRLNITNTGG